MSSSQRSVGKTLENLHDIDVVGPLWKLSEHDVKRGNDLLRKVHPNICTDTVIVLPVIETSVPLGT